ncbi:MAG: NAD(P)H-hydrate epimerase, partial [Pseudomonadota bacterium]
MSKACDIQNTVKQNQDHQCHFVLKSTQINAYEQRHMHAMEQPEMLMNRAAGFVARYISTHFNTQPVFFIIGPGNNGADGLLCAKMLQQQGWEVYCFVLCQKTIKPKWPRLRLDDGSFYDPLCVVADHAIETFDIPAKALVIDAGFGIHQRLPLSAQMRSIIAQMHQKEAYIISIDLPTGVSCDDGQVDVGAVKAKKTLTFQAFKPAHLLQPSAFHCGDVSVYDLGIKISDHEISMQVNHPALWLHHFPVPTFDMHKYSRGALVILVGRKRPGAAILAALAARRLCGAVVLCADHTQADVIRTTYPGFIVEEINDTISFIDFIDGFKANAILIGPGAGLIGSVRDKIIKILNKNIPL